MLQIFTSTVADGSMKPIDASDALACRQRRTTFLQTHNIEPERTTNVRLEYCGEDYCRYQTIDASNGGDGITRESTFVVDGLVTTEPGQALFLPLADCIGAVIYDSAHHAMMLTHLGRHNLEQHGAMRSIQYLVETHHVNPAQLTVWLSPAAGGANYPLFSFDGRSMADVAHEQFVEAGVALDNISVPAADTTIDDGYYSHSEFLKGNRPSDGRFAVACVLL